MTLSEWNDRLEDAKNLLGDVSKDITDLLTMTQFSGPVVMVAVDKMKLRIEQLEKLFAGNEPVRVVIDEKCQTTGGDQ